MIPIHIFGQHKPGVPCILRARRSLFLLAVILILCCSTSAQVDTASISGVITDQSGAIIVGAGVRVTNSDTNVTSEVTSNQSGVYLITGLKPGRYRIKVAREGFKGIDLTDLILNVQDSVNRNFTLQVGSASETVSVEGNGLQINTQDASVSTVIDHQFVANMPLNGRSFQTLLTLTPGVVLTQAVFSEQGQFSVNGQRADANYFTVDGVSANIGASAGGTLVQTAGGALPGFSAWGGTNSLVSVDAMQEFRVQTSTFAPEFGRTPGAQVSVSTRSGTNEWHGTAFDYLRNDIVDANSWFNNRNGLAKPEDRQNDFGGVLGGPIVRDHTFFFVSYEGLRLRLPQSTLYAVPSAAARQAVPAQIQPLLNAYPIPNGPAVNSSFATFAASFSDPSTLNATSLRIDHTFDRKLAVFGRYNFAPSETIERNVSLASTEMRTQTITLGLTQVLTQRFNNEARANYSHVTGSNDFAQDTFGGAVPISLSSLFPSSVDTSNSNLTFALFGSHTWNTGKNARNFQRQLNLLDNLTVSVGRHQLKFGVDYRHLSPINDRRAYDQFLFGNLTSSTGLRAGNMFLALVDANQRVEVVSKNFSTYAQDTWKARSRVTVTYGLRWDIDPAMKGSNGEQPTALQNASSPATFAVAPAGTPLYQTTYGNFAPRIGVAYQLQQRGGWQTVLRSGFGVFYDLGAGSIGQWTGGFPFFAGKRFFNVPYPLTASQATPPSFGSGPPFGAINSADPNLKLPRTLQWNVALEQALGSEQTLSVTYIGGLGRDLLRQEEFFQPNTTFTDAVYVTRGNATSDYHALQLQLNRRVSRGLEALVSYTWAHSIDEASTDSALTVDSPELDRASSDFDIRHTLTAALNYDIPSPGRGKLATELLGGWSANTYLLVRSAAPVDLTDNNVAFAVGDLAPRPEVISGQPLYLFGGQCASVFQGLGALAPGQTCPGGKGFNLSAFRDPPTDAMGNQLQGNFGRNVLRGFGAWPLDFAMARRFRLTEKLALQFRSEFFNLLNHPNFGSPVNDISSPLFGLSTQMLAPSLGRGGVNGGFSPLYQVGGPRSIQFALKLVF